jgi:hypothetical protein
LGFHHSKPCMGDIHTILDFKLILLYSANWTGCLAAGRSSSDTSDSLILGTRSESHETTSL